VAQVSAAFILLLIIVAIFAPLVVKLLGLPSPYTQNPNLTGSFGEPLGPRSGHPFGVDQLGQDVASRVIYGTRVSLEVGVVGTAIAALIGVTLGLLAGFYRGWVDSVVSFLTNTTLSIPLLLLGLGIGAACAVRGCVGGTIQPGVGVVIFLIAFGTWPSFARIVRGLVLSLREREFVEASRVMGNSELYTVLRHILPNCVGPMIVLATSMFGWVLLAESALSFLGLGVPPPAPTWGNMLAASRPFIAQAVWLAIFPGFCISLTLLGINLLGDALRDRLDPRMRGAS
jgi:ABC-type dipeptide/oligopeptide/nickel transport system permease subunit